MTGSRQQAVLTAKYLASPDLIPAGRFEACGKGRIRCVLCSRTGYGVTGVNPKATYPVRERGHRTLLQFFGDQLLVIEGPDTAPPAPRPVKPIHQFRRWQIGCLEDHDWECSCGRRYRSYAPLWRHIGGPRPAGWGRQDGIDHVHVGHFPWPRETTRPVTLNTETTRRKLMDPNSGKLYDSIESAWGSGVKNAVELTGAPEDVQRISKAVSAQYEAKRKAKRKSQKKARKEGRP